MTTTTPKTVMIRSGQAGVFYGELVSRDGDEVVLRHARRCWYWAGAATLSELATRGPGKPQSCKFPAPTEGEHTILNVIEVIEVTDEARERLDAVPVWSES